MCPALSSELHAAVAQEVERGGLAGEHHRVAKVVVEHHRAHAQSPGRRRRGGQRRQRREHRDEMVGQVERRVALVLEHARPDRSTRRQAPIVLALMPKRNGFTTLPQPRRAGIALHSAVRASDRYLARDRLTLSAGRCAGPSTTTAPYGWSPRSMARRRISNARSMNPVESARRGWTRSEAPARAARAWSARSPEVPEASRRTRECLAGARGSSEVLDFAGQERSWRSNSVHEGTAL